MLIASSSALFFFWIVDDPFEVESRIAHSPWRAPRAFVDRLDPGVGALRDDLPTSRWDDSKCYSSSSAMIILSPGNTAHSLRHAAPQKIVFFCYNKLSRRGIRAPLFFVFFFFYVKVIRPQRHAGDIIWKFIISTSSFCAFTAVIKIVLFSSLEPWEESRHCVDYLKFHCACTIWPKNAENLQLLLCKRFLTGALAAVEHAAVVNLSWGFLIAFVSKFIK